MSNIALCIPAMNLIFGIEIFMCNKCIYVSWFRKMSDQKEEFVAQNTVNASEENDDAFETINIPVPSEELPESDQTEDNESEVELSGEGHGTHAEEESSQRLPSLEPNGEEQPVGEVMLPKHASYSPRHSPKHYRTEYDNAMLPARGYSGSLTLLNKIKAIKESLKTSMKDSLATGIT